MFKVYTAGTGNAKLPSKQIARCFIPAADVNAKLIDGISGKSYD